MMAIAEQQTVQPTPEPKQATRQQAFKWPTQAQLRRSAPIFALLAEIWAIPEISQIGLFDDGAGIQVWVLMPDEDLNAESAVYTAERTYLNATPIHNFTLRVIPLAKVRPEVLPTLVPVLQR